MGVISPGPAAGRLFQLGGHLQQGIDDLDRGLLLHLVGAQPGLVAPELVLLGSRQIPVAAVGQLDREARLEGAAGLQFQADLGEDLEGDRKNAQLADPHGLEQDADRLGASSCWMALAA